MDGSHDPSYLRFEQNERACVFGETEGLANTTYRIRSAELFLNRKRLTWLSWLFAVLPDGRGEPTIGQLSQCVTPRAALTAYEKE